MTTPWEKLPEMIELRGGFMTENVGFLLALAKAGAAKVRVVEGIERELAANKIGHLPPSIPRNQNARVLLYNQKEPHIGLVLYLAQQLAEGKQDDGSTVESQVHALEFALNAFGRPSTKDENAA